MRDVENPDTLQQMVEALFQRVDELEHKIEALESLNPQPIEFI